MSVRVSPPRRGHLRDTRPSVQGPRLCLEGDARLDTEGERDVETGLPGSEAHAVGLRPSRVGVPGRPAAGAEASESPRAGVRPRDGQPLAPPRVVGHRRRGRAEPRGAPPAPDAPSARLRRERPTEALNGPGHGRVPRRPCRRPPGPGPASPRRSRVAPRHEAHVVPVEGRPHPGRGRGTVDAEAPRRARRDVGGPLVYSPCPSHPDPNSRDPEVLRGSGTTHFRLRLVPGKVT